MITQDNTLSHYLDATVLNLDRKAISTKDLMLEESAFIARLAEHRANASDPDSYRYLFSFYGKLVARRYGYFLRLGKDGCAPPQAQSLLSSAARLLDAMGSLDAKLYREELQDYVGRLRRTHRKKVVLVPASSAKEESLPAAQPTEQPKVISGTQGLADYLGCSKTKAFGIIKSKVLEPDAIQYLVGGVWKFNRERLDKFIAADPEVLGRRKPL